jgi:hypothetical protein
MNPVEGSFTLMRRPFEDLSGRDCPDILAFLGGLPKEQVRTAGGSEDGDHGRQIILFPTQRGDNDAFAASDHGTFPMKRHAT